MFGRLARLNESLPTWMVETVELVWGLQGLDRRDAIPNDQGHMGKVILDPSFDPTSRRAQQRILEICQIVRKSGGLKVGLRMRPSVHQSPRVSVWAHSV
jgi:hypothetical protein